MRQQTNNSQQIFRDKLNSYRLIKAMKGVKNGQNPDGGPHTYNEMTNISEALHSEVQFMRPLSDQLRGRLER